MIIGRNLIEKMYSEIQEEKLYSTGNDYLDDLLEKAFCEGYEYAQREFGRKRKTGLTKEQTKQFFTKTGNRYLNRDYNRGVSMQVAVDKLGYSGAKGNYFEDSRSKPTPIRGKYASDKYRQDPINPIAAGRVVQQTGSTSAAWAPMLVYRRLGLSD